MTASSVTLEEVLSAAETRRASLVPETSGYLALAIGDATARLPFRVQERAVMLTTEGSVVVERGREVVPPPESARALRDILARLLDASVGSMPGLASAARPRAESEQGVVTVVEELEAALIPVNRAAARRALARLARETLRAKAQGKLRRRKARQEPPRAELGGTRAEAPGPTAPAIAPGAPVADPARPAAAFERREDGERPDSRLDALPAVTHAEPSLDRPPAPEVSAEVEIDLDDPVGALPEVEPTPTRFEATTFDFDPPPADATILDVETSEEPAPAPLAAAPAPLAAAPAPAPAASASTDPDGDAVAAIEAAIEHRAPESAPREARQLPTEARPRATARIRNARTSDVDDLLSRFATQEMSSADLRQARSELKIMVGLEPTDPPPEVESVFPSPDDSMTPTRFLEPRATAIEGRAPNRVRRMSLALSAALIVAGLAVTVAIYAVYPAFFAGKSSAVAGER